ncbi:DUF3885 domain-containing protein [Hymenobacter sp. NST-14]|uniref:DUF3885 domain-containing protein n=1 Tax=Hymenobacter piscis TaxID=2839984 RepID=UPI001C024DBA|nr:DUF3885 domain-containing protein [Hymenobacter piscis]MBT9393895.1 DUF3885 domain-containing protein [Hymenobacter piscis]
MATASTEFLRQHYPGLVLGPGLFHSWPIALRFDLQSESSTSDDAYFAEVLRRAAVVFEAVFAPTDEVLVVVQRPRHERWFRRWRFRANHLVLRLLKSSKQEAAFQRLANRTRFADTRQLIRFTVPRRITTIPHRQILQAISHQDFPSRTPQLHDDVFFLNLRSKLILHMYDDRGLDLISPDVETLRPFHADLNHLLLDYDREQMTATFALTTSAKP